MKLRYTLGFLYSNFSNKSHGLQKKLFIEKNSFFSVNHVKIGVRTTDPEDNCPLVRVRV